MRKIASIGIAISALGVATVPTRADDQTIGLATGQIGGFARSAQTDNQQAATWRRDTVRRATPFAQVSREAYAGFAQDGAYVRICSHIGGPKDGGWTCR